ncbi:MAG: hypothetical protein JWN95_1276 [Frankiales bacterium]|nr:hypothetical protein [Frankiales bacterium]
MLASTESATMGFSEVSTLLWREREALQLLLFKLVEEQLIVSAGESRWLAPANDEVEIAIERLRGTEVLRAAEVEALTTSLGRPTPLTLAELAEVSPEPWGMVLSDHRTEMLKLVAQIEQAADANRKLLAAGARAVRETLLSISDDVDTYDAQGHTRAGLRRPSMMDEQA